MLITMQMQTSNIQEKGGIHCTKIIECFYNVTSRIDIRNVQYNDGGYYYCQYYDDSSQPAQLIVGEGKMKLTSIMYTKNISSAFNFALFGIFS